MYKNFYKDVFIDRYEQFDVMEDYTNLLKKIEELKLYIIKFFKNGKIKPKVYFFDYIVRSENLRLIILITHDKCIFFANNKI